LPTQHPVKRQLRDVNLILWAAWDPIGCGVPTDEYESYAPQILGLLRQGSPIEEVMAMLSALRTGQIGLEPNPPADREVARKLTDWYAEAQVLEETS
jgi:hypothetical protein